MSEETKPILSQDPNEARTQACMAEINDVMAKHMCRFVVVERKVDGVPQKPEVVIVSR